MPPAKMSKLSVIVTLSLVALVYSQKASVKQSESAKAELEAFINEAKQNVNQRYRLTYHIAAPVGWINDPNGFSYYKGNYHLFYQYYPYDSVWGPMHWGHVTSEDLVNWTQQPTALLPEDEQCFSGSAVVDGETMVLIYTGHKITDEDPFFNQTQYLAFSDNGVDFYKYSGNPVIPLAPNGSPEFRDPKAWRHGDSWYVILGSTTEDDRGRVLLYKSNNLIDWEFLSVVAESNGELGYMWECPDFFELGGKHILLMSPQGVEPQGDRYHNLHQTGYIVGHFDYDTATFTPETDFQEIDFGHDFYAAQTTEVNGRRLLVGWFGMWENEFPEATDGWAGAMTMFRELDLNSHKRIVMKPVDEVLSLRDQLIINGEFEGNQTADFDKSAEILIEGDLDEDIDILLEGRDGGGKAWIRWDKVAGKVSVTKEGGDIRQVEWAHRISKRWRLFLDTSSLELFCGEGEVVFSSRVYPLGGWRLTNLSAQVLRISGYSLKRGVPE